MKWKNTLLVVTDLEKAKKFYQNVLGLRVILDFGANVTLTGGICLQTKESWVKLIQTKPENIRFGSNDTELYFEEDNFDQFLSKLQQIPDIIYLHSVLENGWGQRVVRFYDPDYYIIEVGESLKMVCQRFYQSGMPKEEIVQRMDVPSKFVNACLKYLLCCFILSKQNRQYKLAVFKEQKE